MLRLSEGPVFNADADLDHCAIIVQSFAFSQSAKTTLTYSHLSLDHYFRLVHNYLKYVFIAWGMRWSMFCVM